MFRNHASWSRHCHRDVSSPFLKRDDGFCSLWGSAARHATLVPCPHFCPSSTPSGGVDSNKRNAAYGPGFIFLQDDYCTVKRCRYRHDPADLAAPLAGSTSDNSHGSASSGITEPESAGWVATERLVWPAQRPGTEPETAMDSSSWVIHAWRGKRGATEAAVVQGGVAAAVVKAVLLVRLLKDRVAGLAIDLKYLPSSSSGGSESRGSTFGCWRVWQPRRECRSSNSARVGSSSRVRYAI